MRVASMALRLVSGMHRARMGTVWGGSARAAGDGAADRAAKPEVGVGFRISWNARCQEVAASRPHAEPRPQLREEGDRRSVGVTMCRRVMAVFSKASNWSASSSGRSARPVRS